MFEPPQLMICAETEKAGDTDKAEKLGWSITFATDPEAWWPQTSLEETVLGESKTEFSS